MIPFVKKRKEETPSYLERIDELEKVSIVRLKGKITRDLVPMIEERIRENRRAGSAIDKNVIVDFSRVVDVDSSTVAFHVIHLNEYRAKGFEVALIHPNAEMKGLLEVFKDNAPFKVFATEAEAVKALNR
ncbi:MAG: STAS domain-containing protein [Candidatus Omnitrophota bacterium]|nr:STAS domain-containing protein [Candidatus Omnitrophota bacterium]MDZ4241285.1 STAS domain-containing protein [Candidatus Omnitrophota bacterium]